jgi:hypothetical protein
LTTQIRVKNLKTIKQTTTDAFIDNRVIHDMSASNSSTPTRRRKKSTDSEETDEEKISRALKRRKIASKNNNNSEDEEIEIKMGNNDSIEQFQEDQDPSLPKRTRGSRRNSQNNAHYTEVKDLVDQDRGNSSSDTEVYCNIYLLANY